MRGREFSADILDAADEALASLDAVGLLPSDDEDRRTARFIIATALNAERSRLQADVTAAVANESEACRAAVFKALKRGASQ